MVADHTVGVGGPRCGKSWLAREARAIGVPTFCGDPLSTVKEPEDGVTYLPEGIPFACTVHDTRDRCKRHGKDCNGAAVYVSNTWMNMPGPWVLEGHVMARALRRWLEMGRSVPDDWQVIVFTDHHPKAHVTPGQRSMHKGVMSVWEEIARKFPRAEYVRR